MYIGENMFFKKKEISILALFNGEMINLEAVPDVNFSSGNLGKGVAIIPEENEVCAPVSGIITSLFPTLHAIGITTKEGLDLLVHIGINTINLGGMYFEAKVCNKARVKAGNVMLTANMAKIKRMGYEVVTPIVIFNPNDFKEIIYRTPGKVKKGDIIMKVRV